MHPLLICFYWRLAKPFSKFLMLTLLLIGLSYSLSLLSSEGKGVDLGVYGHTYKIVEDDLEVFLKKKLSSLSQDEILQAQQKIQQEVAEKIKNPPPVKGLKEAKSYRKFTYDPSVCAQRDFKDHEGKIIVKKGAYFNPLKMVQVEPLLFLDGTNETHVEWAKTQAENAYWILVKGRPLRLEDAENRAVYFDQQGILTKKFGILHVPARVIQVDGLLQVEEIPLIEEAQ